MAANWHVEIQHKKKTVRKLHNMEPRLCCEKVPDSDGDGSDGHW
jgi:hypothetical protein